jgi:hypothetical protein
MQITSDDDLLQLTRCIAPPSSPIGIAGQTLVADLPPLPPDAVSFVRKFGSGYFDIDGGIFLEVLNPYSSDYWTKQNRDLENLRQLKQSEGAEYIPFDIYPTQPGLLLWGYGEDRKHFFWLTEGDPTVWPVIALHDLEIVTRFDCSMTHLVKQLMCGEIDCAFIGGVNTADNRIDPQACKFVAADVPA